MIDYLKSKGFYTKQIWAFTNSYWLEVDTNLFLIVNDPETEFVNVSIGEINMEGKIEIIYLLRGESVSIEKIDKLIEILKN